MSGRWMRTPVSEAEAQRVASMARQLAVLVRRAGGSIRFTLKELDDVPDGSTLASDMLADGTVVLSFTTEEEKPV